ncbi:hypothetical protein [Dictyobacter arantiisoli]|uniref:RNA polymerase sigma-70 region 2 domain-containing protein n=1 Tax=Dictyobacter arantiisoli TaxID=2014874 RepID=A0A5A5T8M9_9CHLR|nr:hypothetical protein [Dictyobacter arantiisoli]GCF07264.1 hypothetical protein KDI_08280 [Dictyobacter arantiisoli]
MDRKWAIDIMQLSNDFDKTFHEIEDVYRPRFQNVVYCLIGNTKATEEILNEIFSQAYHLLGQCSAIQMEQLNVDQWFCSLALNITNTWLSKHENVTCNSTSLAS